MTKRKKYFWWTVMAIGYAGFFIGAVSAKWWLVFLGLAVNIFAELNLHHFDGTNR